MTLVGLGTNEFRMKLYDRSSCDHPWPGIRENVYATC